MTEPQDPPYAPIADRALDAMLQLAAEKGWKTVTLADVAERAAIDLADLHDACGGKVGLLRHLAQRLDQAVCAGDPPDPSESVRDRLFELLMRRFDAMQPHRTGIASILRESRADPLVWVGGGLWALRSSALMLEAAGVSAWGVVGRLRAKALTALHLAVLRVWLEDDSPDLAKTMAALDKRLGQAESVVSFFASQQKRYGESQGSRETKA